MEDITSPCPYCNEPCYANFVHNGLGYEQVSPYECGNCFAYEASNYQPIREFYDPSTGWYLPQAQCRPTPKGNQMHKSVIAFLVEDSIRGVRCTYEDGKAPTNDVSGYFFKTFDQSIEVGDMVVVETNTRHGMTCVKVVEVDVEPDFDANIEIKWILHKVDLAEYRHMLAQEKIIIDKVQSAEKRRKREALRESLLADKAGEFAALSFDGPPYELTEEAEEEPKLG